MEFQLRVDAKPEGGYFAVARQQGQTSVSYGHGATQLAACIAALANSRLQDSADTQVPDAS